MTNSEELEYRLQKLEAAVEQMKKDDFWVKKLRDTPPLLWGNVVDQFRKGSPCMWDSTPEEDKKKPMMLSCPCPKCNAIC